VARDRRRTAIGGRRAGTTDALALPMSARPDRVTTFYPRSTMRARCPADMLTDTAACAGHA